VNQLYRIEEFYTDGWALIEEDAKQLTKEQCDLTSSTISCFRL